MSRRRVQYPPYTRFAEIYDLVMRDVEYDLWAAYVEDLLGHHGLTARTVIDLCCGTGSSSFPFARRGYHVVGIDRSVEMLAVARARAAQQGLGVRFLCADATSLVPSCGGPKAPGDEEKLGEEQLELGSVDLVVSLFDSLNYVLTLAELTQVFRGVAWLLRPGGAFIFDLNSEQKLSTMNGVSLLEGKDYMLLWRNRYLPPDKIWEITLDGFLRRGDEWERFREVHREKAHSLDGVRERLGQGGLELLGTYHAYTLSPVREDSERVFFVARRPRATGEKTRGGVA